MKLKSVPGLLAFAVALVLASGAFAQISPSSPKYDASKATPYRITRGDVISVGVLGESDLTVGGNRVENVGTITLSLIKDVHVVGLTVAEAADRIAKAYRDQRFLRDPQVRVTVEIYAARQVMIHGQIKNAGKYDMPPDGPMSLKDLIFKAGGLSDTAAGTRVRITRLLPDGQNTTFEKDVASAILGRKSATVNEAEFPVEPDDVVYVPEKII